MTNSKQFSKHPELPLICIYKNKGVEIINKETIKYFNKSNAFSLSQDYKDAEMYSNEMIIWYLEQKSDKFKNNKWNRLLAKTIYNPTFEVSINWIKSKNYKLADLKQKIKICIDKDYDLLTQYVESDFLQSKIDDAKSYSEILDVLNRYRFDVKNENEIMKESGNYKNVK